MKNEHAYWVWAHFLCNTVQSLCRMSAYWLGWSPNTFYRIYTAEAFVLFTLRWALYRIKKWHYYLFDFCYVANVLLLIHLWVFPHSAYLHKVTPWISMHVHLLYAHMLAISNSISVSRLDSPAQGQICMHANSCITVYICNSVVTSSSNSHQSQHLSTQPSWQLSSLTRVISRMLWATVLCFVLGLACD